MYERIKIKKIYIIIALIVFLISVLISCIMQQNSSQMIALGVLISSLILWISESFPMSITVIIMICLMFFMKMLSFEQIVSNLSTNTAIFITASSGMMLALLHSSIPAFITNKIFKRFSDHPYITIFFIGIVVMFFSAFMSSMATCALFTGIVVAVLKQNNINPCEDNFGKAIMLAVPACAAIGGVMTPAGTPANIVVMDIMKQEGTNITFSQWTMIGFPLGLITTIIFLLSVIFFIKPEKIKINKKSLTCKEIEGKEKAIISILGAVILCWFMSGWVKQFNITVLAVVGLLIMFSFKFVKIKDFIKEMNWDIVLLVLLITVLMAGINNSGIVSSITNVIIQNIIVLSPFVCMMVLSVIVCIFRIIIPTTTPFIVLLSPMMISIAKMMDCNVVSYLMLLSYWAAAVLLVVYTEPLYLISYKEGYFKQKELFVSGITTSLVMVVLIPLLMPILVNFANIV